MPEFQPFLSLIIPAYDEEGRLPQTLGQVFAFLGSQPYTSEVIVVENGSRDRTFEIARQFAQQYPTLSVLQSPKGKGHAVRAGMRAARGTYRFFCDADFSMPVTEIARFIPPALDGFDVVIASRESPGAVRYDEPFHRHITGRVFNALIHFVVLPNLQDTQCGFKCFRAEAAEELFRKQTLTGWSFDVEILFIALRRGYRVKELGIPWYFNPESKVSLLKDSWRMFWDVIRIRRNARAGLYD
jgi:glycosyltransferase involved in cell wall biosynthesis